MSLVPATASVFRCTGEQVVILVSLVFNRVAVVAVELQVVRAQQAVLLLLCIKDYL